MAKKITSRPGFFGGMVHYDEHGRKIGELSLIHISAISSPPLSRAGERWS